MIRWILLASLCWPLTARTEVYKWVDKEGNVHFTDQKPETDQVVETVDTSATQLTESQEQAARKRSELLEQSAAVSRATQSEYEQQRSQQKARVKQDRANLSAACQRARKYLDVTQHSNRVYTTDAQGQRTYKSDQERVATADAARKMVNDNCD